MRSLPFLLIGLKQKYYERQGFKFSISDLVTFVGKNMDQVEKTFRSSVEEYIAFCKENWKEPDKPKHING